MNGADALISMAATRMDVCFANPGTTEMPLVAALDRVPGMRAVLGLFEGVCTGAADGYARMADRPALTLLHLGPGFANGIANLHNARRARVPLVNLVGDHASWHLPADAPLTSDIVSLAGPVGSVHTAASAASLPGAFADAFAAAVAPPGGVATLVLPQDAQWDDCTGPIPLPAAPARPGPDDAAVAAAVAALGPDAALYLGGGALRDDALAAATRIQAASGCRIVAETFPARSERGAGRLTVPRLPYFPEQALDFLKASSRLVLVGAPAPVAFFGYRNGTSSLVPEGCGVVSLAGPQHDLTAALEAVADALGAPPAGAARAPEPRPRPEPATGALDPGSLGQTLAALQPADAIVVEEGATSGLPYAIASEGALPHTALGLTGGAIGQGLPCATGAAVACPERRVIALQADGSGMYTLQSLWTQARESLDVTTVICANRSYRILQVELARAGIAEPGPQARALTDLGHPDLDWVSLAKGMGVPARRVDTADTLADALRRSFAEPGPALIEALL